ncbi:MAG: polyphosphate kinase 2 family protein [Woeseia sp.]|jgi:PPK2 family polyphosphate:nucleotide phosphotransferase|nr:polyphosphate kinase 2 family protein [Woeseia sp.]MBT6210995.1 polyphosphate kinase 2 family protein [Woeseia sp.]
MFKAPESEFLVPFDDSFRIEDVQTRHSKRANNKKRLKDAVKQFSIQQQALHASDRHAVLLVFQGMDAAGKDSTISAVTRGVNPAGIQVFSFKKPSQKELDHDFLWRTNAAMPERGRIGIFNRSHYEEVLVVRVHPEILDYQQLPESVERETIWEDRFESIRNQEQHLARNGTVILKFWLNVSKEEQKKRFLARLDNASKHWKFNPGDIKERQCWDEYMEAYDSLLKQTSREWAPWYAIPADSKPFMRATIAELIVNALESIGLKYPKPDPHDVIEFEASRAALVDPVEK